MDVEEYLQKVFLLNNHKVHLFKFCRSTMKHFAQLQGVCQASTILKGCVQQSLKNETSNECLIQQVTFFCHKMGLPEAKN